MLPKYYVPSLAANPLLRLKYKFIDKREAMPLALRSVQIQTISGCNGKCIFCPNQKIPLRNNL